MHPPTPNIFHFVTEKSNTQPQNFSTRKNILPTLHIFLLRDKFIVTSFCCDCYSLSTESPGPLEGMIV